MFQAFHDPQIMEEFQEFLSQRHEDEELPMHDHLEDPHLRFDGHRNDVVNPVF